MTQATNRKADDVFAEILRDSSIPDIYFNGFMMAASSCDAVILLERNGRSVSRLCVPYPIVKNLVLSLGALLANLELRLGRPVLTVEETTELLRDPVEDSPKEDA